MASHRGRVPRGTFVKLLYTGFFAAILVIYTAPRAYADGIARVQLGREQFELQIARTMPELQHGLMGRTSLPPHGGMLFFLPRPMVATFWMLHTPVHLDILFFDFQRRLINVAADAAPCPTPPCPTYRSLRPAAYVIEVPAGTAARLKLAADDRFSFL